MLPFFAIYQYVYVYTCIYTYMCVCVFILYNAYGNFLYLKGTPVNKNGQGLNPEAMISSYGPLLPPIFMLNNAGFRV